MRSWLAAALTVATAVSWAHVWAAPDPSSATVLVRAIGRARALRGEDARAWREALIDRRNVPVGSGTGFLISPQGYVITNLHVVSGETRMLTVEFTKVEVSIEIERIEVELSPSAAVPSRTFAATIVASDPELDLAVLHINAPDLPYAPLGDSDVIREGEAVRVMGFPFGAALEIARGARDTTTRPRITVTSGNVSALRSSEAGDLRFLQTSAPISPGSSGSPMVDGEGYVLGVAQLKLRADDKVAFTIPVNVVKAWLQRNGLDAVLPARLMAPGPSIESRMKGIRVRPPYGFTDVSPARVRVDSGAGAIALHIDRVVSPWGAEQIEAALFEAGPLEPFARSRSDRYPGGERRRLLGHTTGTDPNGREVKMEYAIVDLGREKIVARYVGEAESVAINRGLLHASLTALEVDPLLTEELTHQSDVPWTTVNGAASFADLRAPQGWLVESTAPTSCDALPPPDAAVSLSPVGDFTVALRAASWSHAGAEVRAAAMGCFESSETAGHHTYRIATEFLGTAFRIEGLFSERDGALRQVEVVAPVEKRDAARAVFDEWVKQFQP